MLVLGSTLDHLSPKLRQIEEVRDFFRRRGAAVLLGDIEGQGIVTDRRARGS
jgi:hypothetical protein